MSKRIKKTDFSITVLLIIGILAVANFFSYQLFHRWDLTQNKIYSISDVSRRSVGELNDIVNIKAYFSENLPNQVLTIKQEVADILDEYAAYSNGNIKVEFIDPNVNEQMQQELAMLGIPQLTFEVYEKDQLQLVNGYMGIAISFGGKNEVIPAVKRNTSDLEYQLTTAIKKVVSEQIAIVGILTSHATPPLERGGLSVAKQKLEELYTVQTVSLTAESPQIPVSINTLVIVGPKEQFNEVQLEEINNFLVRGGGLLVLLDGVKVEEGLVASKNETNLDVLLNKYGIKINKDLVADMRSGVASFSQGFFTFSSNYPFWPKANQDGFNQDFSAVANLENVILPWASSIEIDENKIDPESAKFLVFTTNKSWRVTDNFNITPNSATAVQGKQKSHSLTLYVNGLLDNPYAPEGETTQFNGRIVAVGDSDFINDGFLRNSPDNLTFFQNLVDTLSFDEDLINIRSKGISSRPIKENLSDSSRVSIRYLNVFGLTIVVILFGLIRYYMRRRSRFVDEL